MRVKVTSNIPGKTDVAGEYSIGQAVSIAIFVESLGLVWNLDALVVVNEAIVDQDYVLQDGDEIHLLIPILGG
jgi:molybdopterin converting factor small subunit